MVRAVKAGAAVVCISAVIGVCISYPSMATESHLSQQIKPIECVYTTTQTGEQETVTSTCENQPVPTVTQIIIENSRPVIKGTYRASTALMLRVWINGQWYTYGTDARLTTNGDSWTLDLSGLNMSLQAGTYVIVVEVETTDGLLLRNTNAGAFIIAEPPVQAVIGRSPLSRNENNRQFTLLLFPTMVPHADKDVLAPGEVFIAQPWRNDDVRSNEDTRGDEQLLWLKAVVLVAICGAVYLVVLRLKS